MADGTIVTEMDLALNASSQLSDLNKITKSLIDSVLASNALKAGIDSSLTPLNKLAGEAKALKQLLQELSIAALGTGKALATNTAVKTQKSAISSQPEVAASSVTNAQLSAIQSVQKAAAAITQEMNLQIKLQKGIVDLQTLEHAETQANYEIVRLSSLAAGAKGVAQQRINQQLQQEIELQAGIRAQIEQMTSEMAQQAKFDKDYAAAHAQNLKIDQQRLSVAEKQAQIDAQAAQRAQAAANTPQALSRAGANAYNDAEALRKIKQGIVDLDTLAYQKQQSQIEVGRLLQQQAVGQASAQAGVSTQLEQQYNLLRTIEQKEAEISNKTRLSGAFSNSGADLLKIQAQLIINYSVINSVLGSIRFGATFVKDLDEEFHQLQAIGALTNVEMTNLSASILEIGQSSKFSTVEIAKTAVVLAQAGLSGSQIKESLKSIVDLATASGSSLADAAQNVTTVLNVFNYQASQTANIANIMTASLNQSKLTMEQLTQGIAYASNTAANAGVSFTEMIATFGLLADAGIRSGSTLGTGYRKLITDLVTPTEKFKIKVAELGLNLADLDVQTHGVTEVLTRLHNAGFTAADAMQTLDIRASAVAIPLLKGADSIGLFEQRLYLSQAAVQASATQMESLTSSLNKLQNAFGSLIYDTFKSWVSGIASVTSSIADMINSLGALKPVVVGVLQAFATLASGAVIIQLSKLVLGLSGVTAAFGGLATIGSGIGTLLTSWASGLEVVTVGTTALVAEATGLGVVTVSLLPIFAAIAAAVAFFALAVFGTGSKLSGLNEEADKAKGKLANLRGEMDASANKTQQLDEYIADLIKKHDELGHNSEALTAKILEGAQAFNGMGTEVIRLGDDIDTLILKAEKLRQQNLAAEIGKTQAYIGQLKVTSAITDKQIQEQIKTQPGKIESLIRSDSEIGDPLRGTETVTTQNVSNAAAKIGDAVADALKKDTPLEDIQGLLYQVGTANAQAITEEDKKSEAFYGKLTELLKARAGALGERGVSSIDQKLTDAKAAGLAYTTEFGAQIQTLLDKADATRSTADKGFASGVDANGNPVKGGDAIKALSDIRDELKDDLARRTSGNAAFVDSPSFKQESAKLAQINEDITNKINQQNQQLDAIGKLDDKLLEQKISNYESEIKVSSIAQARVLANAAEADADKIRATKRDAAQRYVDSPAFKTSPEVAGLDQNSPGFRQIQQKTLETMLNAADEGFTQVKNRVENALKQKEGTGTIAGNKEIRSSIDELRDSIRATNTAYKEQLNALERTTDALKAHRAALDLPGNAPFVSDARRQQAEDALNAAEADKAIAQKNLLSAQLATQQADLLKAQAIAGTTYEAASAARGTASEEGGSPDGRVSSSQFGINKSSNSKAVSTVLKQGDAIVATSKSLDVARAAAAKYEEQIDKSNNALDTFTETFTYFQQKSYYGARAMGQDFYKLFGDIQSGFGDVVKNFLNGTKSISQSFRDLGISIISTLEDIAIKRTTQSLFDSILPSAGGASAGGAPSAGFFTTALKFFGFSGGGAVPKNAGTPGVDSVPTMLTPGEGILNNRAMSLLGVDGLNKLNNGNANVANSSNQLAQPGSDKNGIVNVYVVSPDQVPGLGPNDVIAVISDNIARGGSVKTLIKSVMT